MLLEKQLIYFSLQLSICVITFLCKEIIYVLNIQHTYLIHSHFVIYVDIKEEILNIIFQ